MQYFLVSLEPLMDVPLKLRGWGWRFHSYYILCETCHCRASCLWMQVNLFILISISVWADKNDEWWFSSYRYREGRGLGGCVLLISSYFIRSTNHHHPPWHVMTTSLSVYIQARISKVTSNGMKRKSPEPPQADNVNKVYARKVEGENSVCWTLMTVNANGPCKTTLFSRSSFLHSHGMWPGLEGWEGECWAAESSAEGQRVWNKF